MFYLTFNRNRVSLIKRCPYDLEDFQLVSFTGLNIQDTGSLQKLRSICGDVLFLQ